MPPPRPFRYHVYHRDAFNALPNWASHTITVAGLSGSGPETKDVYSLKKDMDQLRVEGAAKGIVDAGVVDVGTSARGRKLWALKVGLGTSHKVLFTGCHHAREWISVEIPYLVAEYLIEKYTATPTTEKEKRIKHLLHNRQIWFVPMVNPDGHVHTMTAPPIGKRGWRPNRKAYPLSAGTIAAPRFGGGAPRPISYPAGTYTGVDINRNYATPTWGQETFKLGSVKTSRDPQDSGENSIWCGRSGSGEAESQAIDALIAAQNFRASITYHSFSQLLLYPDAASADAYVQWVGSGMRDLINDPAHGNPDPYTYQSGSALYPTTGDLMDFSYNRMPARPTFTPELRPTEAIATANGWAFSGLPESEIGPCFREHLGAALALINCAGHNASTMNRGVSAATAMPASKCQIVRHCWEVFRAWTP